MPRPDSEFSRHLARVIAQLGIELSIPQTEVLEQHYKTLQRWNRKINLTALRNPAEIAERHFGESLFLGKELGHAPGSVLDVGSGAGFPGVPVAVFHPRCQVTLLEPVGKKFAFLKEISRFLPNVFVLQGRLSEVEDVFEWATMRGVSVVPIIDQLRARAGRLAVLTTREAASDFAAFEEILWERELVIPWGQQRILLMGRHSCESPRST